MGITPAMLRLLARHVASAKVSGSVLTFGTQDVWGSEDDVRRLLDAESMPVRDYTVRPSTSAFFAQLTSENPEYARYIHPRTLFEMLGFTEYVDLDSEDHDGAAVRHDLNETLPASLTDRFDLVLDFGTTEHVFAVPSVLTSVTAALRKGGWVVHSLPVPCLYWAQHGYYCFNPDMFLDFYEANGFTDVECRIVYYDKPFMRPVGASLYHRNAKTFPYKRGTSLDYLLPADAVATFWLVAKKGKEGSAVVWPNQKHDVAMSAPREQRRSALMRAAYFALLPFAGRFARRAYAHSRGLTLSTI